MIEVMELIITGRRRSVHHFSQNHAILMILSGRRLTGADGCMRLKP